MDVVLQYDRALEVSELMGVGSKVAETYLQKAIRLGFVERTGKRDHRSYIAQLAAGLEDPGILSHADRELRADVSRWYWQKGLGNDLLNEEIGLKREVRGARKHGKQDERIREKSSRRRNWDYED